MEPQTPIHPARLAPQTLMDQCRVERTRGGGPGGQHRNKVETAIRLTHLATGISAAASERRQQEVNRKMALFRLRVNLALGVRLAVEDPSPSALWSGCCRGGRVAVNPEHRDFPALLAEVLDAVADCAFDVKPAAERLGVSASQLIKFLKLEARALGWVNEQRAERGLGKLR